MASSDRPFALIYAQFPETQWPAVDAAIAFLQARGRDFTLRQVQECVQHDAMLAFHGFTAEQWDKMIGEINRRLEKPPNWNEWREMRDEYDRIIEALFDYIANIE